MSRIRGAFVVLAVAVCGLGTAAPAANAAFHLMKIREVFLGTGSGNDAFVELQMYAAGQTQVAGHKINTFTAAGAVLDSFTIPSNVPNGQSQRTILIGDTDVPGRDITYNQLGEKVVGHGPRGVLCFDGIDCVSWGIVPSFATPSPVGNPVLPDGIPTGQSIQRKISPNCPTLLEAADDTNDSATDFAQGAPSPRSNAVQPTETPCQDGGSGSGPDLILSGMKKQKAGGKVVVKAQCTDQDCSLAAKGKSVLKGGAKSSATASGTKAVKLKKDTADVAAGETVKLKLKHSKSGRRKVKRSVILGGKAKAVVKVTATGANGSTTEKFKAKLQ